MPRFFSASALLVATFIWTSVPDVYAQQASPSTATPAPASPAPTAGGAYSAPRANEDIFQRNSREDQVELARIERFHAPTGELGRRITEIREALAQANQGPAASEDAYIRTQMDFAAYNTLVERYRDFLNQANSSREASPRSYEAVNELCNSLTNDLEPQLRSMFSSRLGEISSNAWRGVADQRTILAVQTLFRDGLNMLSQIKIRCQNLRNEQTAASLSNGQTLGEMMCANDPYMRTIRPIENCLRRFTEGGLLAPQRGGQRAGPPQMETNPPPRVLQSPTPPKSDPTPPLAQPNGNPQIGGGQRPANLGAPGR